MNTKVNIKFGAVNNLSDARYAAGCGASFLGFNFNPEHPQYLDTEKFKEIAGWIDGPMMVAEWDDLPASYIRSETESLGLDYIQLNAFNQELSEALSHFTLIQNFDLDHCKHFNEIILMVDAVQKHTKYYLLSFTDYDKQLSFLNDPHAKLLLIEFCRSYPVIFNFVWTSKNVLSTLEEFHPFGINISGSAEERPGVKDFADLNSIIDLLEI